MPTAAYLFAAAVGVPLVAWSLLGGSSEDGAGAEADEGFGGAVAQLFTLSTIALALAAFGVCGLALRLVDAGAGVTAACAVGAGLVGAVLNSTVLSYLRRSETAADVSDAHLAGSIGRVVLPVGEGQRGRIAISAGGQEVFLSARLPPSVAGQVGATLEAGAPVLVVEVSDGIATIARLDPELT